MQVALAVGEIERREQYLAGEQALGCQSVLVDAHESRLADRRQGLKRHRVGSVPAERGYRRDAGGDRTRGDDHDRVAISAQAGDLTAELADRSSVDRAVGRGHRARADLRYYDHCAQRSDS